MAASQEEVDKIQDAIRGIHDQLGILNHRVGTYVDHERVGEMQQDIDRNNTMLGEVHVTVNEYKVKMDNFKQLLDDHFTKGIENHESKLIVMDKEIANIEKGIMHINNKMGTAIMGRTSI